MYEIYMIKNIHFYGFFKIKNFKREVMETLLLKYYAVFYDQSKRNRTAAAADKLIWLNAFIVNSGNSPFVLACI